MSFFAKRFPAFLFLLGTASFTSACNEECTSAQDCLGGEICYRSVCTPATAEFNACDTDNDCNSGNPDTPLYCEFGRCRLRPVDAPPASDAGVTGDGGGPVGDGGPVGGDAAVWEDRNAVVGGALCSVHGVAIDDIWAVGPGGTIAHFDGTDWVQVPAPAGTNARKFDTVFQSSATSVWAVGEAGLVAHYDGSDWSVQTVPDARGFNGIWMMPDDSDGWMVGNEGAILRYQGGQWVVSTSTVPDNDTLFDVFSVDGSDVWAVGDLGRIIRYQNGVWSNITEPYNASGGAMFRKVHATDPSNVWVIGQAGWVFHYDGSNWSDRRTVLTTTQLDGLVTFGPNNTYISGGAGNLWRWQGGWIQENSGTLAPLLGVYGVVPNDIWVVGAAGGVFTHIRHGPP